MLLRRSNIPGNIQYINRRLDRTAGWQAACKHERHYGHLQYAHVETEKIYGPHHAAANTQAALRVLHFGLTSLPVAPPRCQPRQEPPLDLVVGNATPGGARPRGSASAATAPAVAGALRRQWLEPKVAPVFVAFHAVAAAALVRMSSVGVVGRCDPRAQSGRVGVRVTPHGG